MDIGEPVVATLEAIAQSRVLHAHEVQRGGIQVMNVDWVFDDVIAEVVRLAEDVTLLHSCARHPHTEAAWMMIAPIVVLRECALRIGRAAKLTAPDHERVIEQPAVLEFGEQGSGRLVRVVALAADIARQIAMLIPTAMVELDKAHPALGQLAA